MVPPLLYSIIFLGVTNNNYLIFGKKFNTE